MANLARNVSKMIYKVKSPKNGQFDEKSGNKFLKVKLFGEKIVKTCFKVKFPKNGQFGEKSVKNYETHFQKNGN